MGNEPNFLEAEKKQEPKQEPKHKEENTGEKEPWWMGTSARAKNASYQFLREANIRRLDRTKLQQLLEHLNGTGKHPERVIGRTYLFFGSPGTGKTHLTMRIIANANAARTLYTGDTYIPEREHHEQQKIEAFENVEKLLQELLSSGKKNEGKAFPPTLVLADDVLNIMDPRNPTIQAYKTQATLKRLIEVVRQRENTYLLATTNVRKLPSQVFDRFDERIEVNIPQVHHMETLLKKNYGNILSEEVAEKIFETLRAQKRRGLKPTFRDIENILRSAYAVGRGKITPAAIEEVLQKHYINSHMQDWGIERPQEEDEDGDDGDSEVNAETCSWKCPRLCDLIGLEGPKRIIGTLNEWIRRQFTLDALDVRTPPRYIFVGPPGVGKTLFSRVLAKELGLKFYKAERNDIKYGGLKHILRRVDSTTLVFLDEADKLANETHDEDDPTLAELQEAIEGLEGCTDAIIVLSANSLRTFSKSFVSRFGIVKFDLPTDTDRREFFKRKLARAGESEHGKKLFGGSDSRIMLPLAEELSTISRNCSFRDMEWLWGETITHALINGTPRIGIEDFSKARENNWSALSQAEEARKWGSMYW